MTKHQIRLALALYVGVAILTFGSAWQRVGNDQTPDVRGFTTVICSAFWPLYWSEEAWRPKK